LDGIEKLWVFYLGREYDLEEKKATSREIMYDAGDLTTHAVCLGMTGSGKTGLCIDLLEEAALDRVPALIIDPKGDITNLLLTFPELRTGDFRDFLYYGCTFGITSNPALELYGKPGEKPADFRARCEEKSRELRDGETEKLREATEVKLQRLKVRLEKEEMEDLEEEVREKAGEIAARWEKSLDAEEPLELKPRRADVRVQLLSPVWIPSYRIGEEGRTTVRIPARKDSGPPDA